MVDIRRMGRFAGGPTPRRGRRPASAAPRAPRAAGPGPSRRRPPGRTSSAAAREVALVDPRPGRCRSARGARPHADGAAGRTADATGTRRSRVPARMRNDAGSGDRVKILVYDGTGLVLYAKRLEAGRFCWPAPAEGTVRLTGAQLATLLEGLPWNVLRPRPVRRPSAAC